MSYEVVPCECEIFGVFIREGVGSHRPGLRVIMGTVPCKKEEGGMGCKRGGVGGERVERRKGGEKVVRRDDGQE